LEEEFEEMEYSSDEGNNQLLLSELSGTGMNSNKHAKHFNRELAL
jgi:hypothetical protein